MKIFNLAEELEKERQKNKELQKDVNKYVCYYRYVKMEKEDLQERINKAMEYIKERTTDEDTGKHLGYSDMIDDEILLNILKGE